MPDDGAPTPAEAEVERLRAEVAALRSQVATQDLSRGEAAPRAARQRWRSVVASLLIVIGCILVPLSVVSVWARNLVTDPDQYLATVAPLARDPAIQNAVADKVTAQMLARLNVDAITKEVVDALAARGLPPAVAGRLQSLSGPLASGVESFVRTEVGKVVASDRFADAWVSANRAAHQALVAVLTGQTGPATSIEDGTVSINIGPIIEEVKQRLVDSGFELASRIPVVDASFVLFQSDKIVMAQSAFRLLTILGNWLPVISLSLLAVGVVVAKNHLRALAGAGLGIATGMVVLALGLAVFREVYLNGVPADVLPQDAAAVLYDTLVRFLRTGLRTVFVLGLVVALAGFLAGRSRTAVRARAGVTGAIGRLRGGAEQAGLRTGPVGSWVYANRRPLRIGVVALAAVVLVFWDRPTGQVIIVLALLVVVVLAILEFLGRPPQPGALETPAVPTREPGNARKGPVWVRSSATCFRWRSASRSALFRSWLRC